jgi:hypothetical protein
VSERPIPLLGDVSLEYVQHIEHALDGGFVSTRIAGLSGELQQRLARPSHRIAMTGVLVGDGALDALGTLQAKAASGEELTFAADITTALELQKVVITAFRAREQAAHALRIAYEIELAESPPLPPPATLDPFGGLGDFGLGDLGFDTDLLGELEGLADQVAGAVDAALEVAGQLGALASLADLGDLSLGNFMAPIGNAANQLPDIGSNLMDASRSLSEAFGL